MRRGSIFWLLGLATLALGDETQQLQKLHIGMPIAGELVAGGKHAYELEVAAGQDVVVRVEQLGVDVTVSVMTPAGESFAIDSPTYRQGPETVVLGSGFPGLYRVEVLSAAVGAPSGRYEIRVEALPAERLAGEQAMTRAGRAYSPQTSTALREALATYEEALALWRALGDRRSEARVLFSLANLNRRLGDSERVLELAATALVLWRDLGDQEWEARTLDETGFSHFALNRPAEAREALETALGLHRAAGRRDAEAGSLNGLCLVRQRQGELRAARDCFEQVLGLLYEVGDRRDEAAVLHNLANVYRDLGEPQLAFERLEQVLALKRAEGDLTGEARTLNSFGVLHRGLGELQEALDGYERALDIFREVKDRRNEATALSNVGLVYVHLGESERALAYLEPSLAMRRELGNRSGEAATLNNLGLAQLQLGHPRQALELHRQALAISRAVPDRRAEAAALDLMGRAFEAVGELGEAQSAFESALEIARAAGDRPREAEALHSRGRIALSRAHPETAVADLTSALALQRAVRDRAGEARTLAALAQTERVLGRPEEARANAEAAVAIIESLRIEVDSPQLRAAYLSSQSESYELLIDLLMELHKHDPGAGWDRQALTTSERARARTLVELLREARADLRAGIAPDLRERLASTQRRLSAKTSQLLTVLDAGRSEEETTLAEREQIEALAALESVEAAIRGRDPRFAALTNPQPLEIGELQTLLEPQTALLEIALGEKRSFLWLMTSDDLASFELPPRDVIEDLARRAHQELRTLVVGTGSDDQATTELGRMLLGPVAARLGDRRLVVVADGALHYVPFGALSLSEDGVPLLVEREVVALPSASMLALIRRAPAQPPATRWLAVFADPVFDPRDPRVGASMATATVIGEGERSMDPDAGLERLPATRREAEAIAALAPSGEAWMVLDFEANRSAVLDGGLGRFRVIHFATHGVIDGRRPQLAGLMLSQVDATGRQRDGLLSLHDVYSLRLSAELVVLSGCETALGRELRSEGLVGLTRGFMYAGVPRVVASRWRAQDRVTAELMARFYRGMWQEKLPPPAALRAAQLSIRADRRWRDPYFWAGFVLEGEWR